LDPADQKCGQSGAICYILNESNKTSAISIGDYSSDTHLKMENDTLQMVFKTAITSPMELCPGTQNATSVIKFVCNPKTAHQYSLSSVVVNGTECMLSFTCLTKDACPQNQKGHNLTEPAPFNIISPDDKTHYDMRWLLNQSYIVEDVYDNGDKYEFHI